MPNPLLFSFSHNADLRETRQAGRWGTGFFLLNIVTPTAWKLNYLDSLDITGMMFADSEEVLLDRMLQNLDGSYSKVNFGRIKLLW